MNPLVCCELIDNLITIETDEIKKSERLKTFYLIVGITVFLIAIVSYCKPALMPLHNFTTTVSQILSIFGVFVTGVGLSGANTIAERKRKVLLMQTLSKRFDGKLITDDDMEQAKNDCKSMIDKIDITK